MHQQNVNWSGSNTQSSQTLQVTSPLLLSSSRCSQTPLELSEVLSDSVRGLSGAPERTYRYGGAFSMLRDLTHRMVQCWSCCDLCPYLQETLREAETAAQLCRKLREQPRLLRSFCGRLGAVFSQQWYLPNHKAFHHIIFIFVTSYYGMYYLSLSIYIHTINLAADGTRA